MGRDIVEMNKDAFWQFIEEVKNSANKIWK